MTEMEETSHQAYLDMQFARIKYGVMNGNADLITRVLTDLHRDGHTELATSVLVVLIDSALISALKEGNVNKALRIINTLGRG